MLPSSKTIIGKKQMARCSVGIAGYMGSGKTSCCMSLAAREGFFVVNGDLEARKMMEQTALVKRQLAESFGSEIVEKGVVSFKKLGTLVFDDPIKLQKLNTIVHPLLLDRLRKTIFEGESGIIVVDAALLPLWNIEDWFDVCIWIEASFATRLARLMHKGLGLTDAELRTRMRQQEALFPPPAAGRWTYIGNEHDRAALDEAVVSRIQNVVETKEKSL